MPENPRMFQSGVVSKIWKSRVGSSRLWIPKINENKFWNGILYYPIGVLFNF